MNDEKKFSILLVDDNPHNLQVLADVLESCGYDTGFATSGKDAIDYIKLEKPDLILLDVMMPDMNGYETCQYLKDDSDYADIPIIFLTAKVEIDDIVKGFEVGGIDYITKPFNSAELKSRVKTHLELKKAQDELKSAYDALCEAKVIIEKQNEKLSETMTRLEVSASTDPLTGIGNRRSMISMIKNQQEQLKENETFSIVMADIDHFKLVNDTFGHDAGDEVLVTIANLIKTSIRKDDYFARWGGEEFLIMFANTPVKQAELLTERIRTAVNNHAFLLGGTENTITLTFGLAEYQSGDTIDAVIKQADSAMYKGKNEGRNKVVIG